MADEMSLAQIAASLDNVAEWLGSEKSMDPAVKVLGALARQVRRHATNADARDKVNALMRETERAWGDAQTQRVVDWVQRAAELEAERDAAVRRENAAQKRATRHLQDALAEEARTNKAKQQRDAALDRVEALEREVEYQRAAAQTLPCTCDYSGQPDEPHKAWCQAVHGPHAECRTRIEALEAMEKRARVVRDGEQGWVYLAEIARAAARYILGEA